MITSHGWANLHGPIVNAANTRAMSGFFRYLASKYLDNTDALHHTIITLLAMLDDMNKAIWSGPMFMSDAQSTALKGTCSAFGIAYMQAREACRLKGYLCFEIIPKVHKSQRLPTMANVFNPSRVNCYGEESSIGTTCTVWKKNMAGRYSNHVQRVVLGKRLLGLLIRLEDL